LPIVRIELYKGFDTGHRKKILDGVHRALVESFKIPDSDRNQLVYEFDDDNFERSKNKSLYSKAGLEKLNGCSIKK